MPVRNFFQELLKKGARVKTLSLTPSGDDMQLKVRLFLGKGNWVKHYQGEKLVYEHLVKNSIAALIETDRNKVDFTIRVPQARRGLLEKAHGYLLHFKKAENIRTKNVEERRKHRRSGN